MELGGGPCLSLYLEGVGVQLGQYHLKGELALGESVRCIYMEIIKPIVIYSNKCTFKKKTE